jgi:DNA-binding response OmpR family regulator
MNTVPAPPRRILIVDDDDTTRRGLVALMAGAGFVAIPAGSLQEATAALERDAPDLIITDIRLQGYNGLQILAMGSRPIPAIVVTGYPDRSIESDARKMGAEYLLKPISPAHLLALVQQKLEASTPNAIFSATRRYARKPVTRHLKAWVQDLPVRILDISYGGLRLEIERTPKERLPRSMSMTLPTSNVAIDVNVVWQKPSGESGWLCGAAIPDTSQTTWRQLVDAVASL